MTIVQHLSPVLPEGYTAEPRVHLGSYYEIDVCTFEDAPRADYSAMRSQADAAGENSSEPAAATYAPPQPTLVLDAELDDQYEYEVLFFDQSRNRLLVAAIEIVSPANKDRPENRRAFVAKCAALLQKHVCVSIVDLVTIRNFNLYCDLLELIGRSDPSFASPPATYAVTCRGHKVNGKSRFEAWAYPLAVGQRLPTLPVWLTADLAVFVNLEASYEETCRVLRLPTQQSL
jgi:hypothetical protein